jgi:hypothetical protein
MKRASPKGPGLTIGQFASEVDLPQSVIRSAVRNGTIKAISFNKVRRIPLSEKERFLTMWHAPFSRDDMLDHPASLRPAEQSEAGNDLDVWVSRD